MSDLVKRARKAAIDNHEMLGDIHVLITELADEIERLELHLALYRHHKTVLDDLREWGQHRYVNTVDGHIDAYAKDKLK